jgi:hypothetical protein
MQDNATIANAIFSKAVRRMLGLSLHGWENAMVASLAFAAFFAIIVGVSTYCVVQLQRIELADSKRELDEYKLTVEGQVATANSIGLSAKAEASKAQENIAIANAAADEARLETERIKERLAWREITPAQQEALKSALRGAHFEIPMGFIATDPESATYADQLADALVAVGISVNLNATVYTGPVFGVRISDTHTQDQAKLKEALTAANIPFALSAATPELRMSLGSKPRR